MFDAVLFLGGAVLFLLAVVFFVVLWQQRLVVEQREATLTQMEAEIREQRVDLEILERELTVWEDGLSQEQRMLEEAKEELRMLTAARQPELDRNASDGTYGDPPGLSDDGRASIEREDEGRRYLEKNISMVHEEETKEGDRDF
jgi:hypothetical protein